MLSMYDLVDFYAQKSNFTYRYNTFEGNLRLSVELPGVDPKDVDVCASDSKIIVEVTKQGKKYIEAYSLSSVYNVESAIAKMENGLLEIVVNPFSNKSLKIPINAT
jgi:HSP20 family molecular chaperone IbpA